MPLILKTCYKRDELLFEISNIILFLFAFRFLNKNNTFLLLYVIICSCFCLRYRSLKISRECVILIIYGILYYITRRYWGLEGNITNILTLALGAPLMYMSGREFMRFSKNKEIYYKKVIWILSFGMFLFAFLSFLKNGIVIDYENSADVRAIPDIWTGELWQATNINGYCVMAIIMSIVLIMQKIKGIKLVSSCLILVGSIYLTMVTAARTNLFIVVFVLISYAVLSLVMKKIRYMSRKEALNKYIKIMFGIIILFFLIVNYKIIVELLPMEAFQERLNNRSLSLSEDGRWQMWKIVIGGLNMYFWGNNTSIHLAHNLYLDVAREAGVISMILLIVYTIMVLFTAIKFLCDNEISINVRILNCIIIFSLLASFMIEPVMNAKPFIFIIFCMICGMQYEMTTKN